MKCAMLLQTVACGIQDTATVGCQQWQEAQKHNQAKDSAGPTDDPDNVYLQSGRPMGCSCMPRRIHSDLGSQ